MSNGKGGSEKVVSCAPQRKKVESRRLGLYKKFNQFIEQKDRSATYIGVHEVHVETIKNTHVYQTQNTYTVYTLIFTRLSYGVVRILR